MFGDTFETVLAKQELVESGGSGYQVEFFDEFTGDKLVALNFIANIVPKEQDFGFGNVFDTDEKSTSIRLEIQPDRFIYIIIGNAILIKSCAKIVVNDENTVIINYNEITNNILFGVNGCESYSQFKFTSENVFSELAVKTGYFGKRGFSGSVSSMQLILEYRRLSYLGIFMRSASLIFLLAFCFLVRSRLIKLINA